MADEVTKFLARVTKEERNLLLEMVDKILKNKLAGLNAKKLVGSTNVYRVRKGKFRLIYKRTKSDCIIMSIDRRSEKTYRDF